ncbi:MAG: cation:proton antiporter [Tannerellaceae bacterium]|nr:cation:proton antiporter [Tannerellaceae bacterium]
MAHLPTFVTDLAIILITAGIATILFKWLKQPVVLGYIVAGVIAGPFITWLPTVTEMVNVETWAEIGVIFLLFALGLEFSFKKVIEVGGTASIATLINMGSMIVIGYIVGQLLGWSSMDSIFLGGMLSMSSTTIIIKAFTDMRLQKQKFATIVFGMLIVEDLAAILMMVLLSTVASSSSFGGGELFNSIFRLFFFVLIWFIAGIYIVPTMLRVLKKYLNDETLLILSVGLCLGMVLFAARVGFSAALGAFIMGSILAETILVKHIEHLVEPLKNLFGAVFFVSVGMLLDPHVIVEYAGLIVMLTLVVLIGRVIFATAGVLAAGHGLKVSIQAGCSLAQIGEFSFIIASLGMSLGVIRPELYPIIVAVSIITTFTTPYFIKYATPLYYVIEDYIPSGWEKLIHGYKRNLYEPAPDTNDWVKLLKSIAILVGVYFTIALAVELLSEEFLIPFVNENLPGVQGHVLAAVITLLFMAPFLRAIVMKKNRSEEFRKLWQVGPFNRVVLIFLIVVRMVICIGLVLKLLIPLFPGATVLMGFISLGFIVLVVYFQGFKKQSRMIEERFLKNLNQKELQDQKQAAFLPKTQSALLSKQIHIEEIEISPLSPKVGKTLKESNFRRNTGVHIVSIIRGNKKINIPDANERLYPYDKIIVAGSDKEIQRIIQTIEERNQMLQVEEPVHHISLIQY